MGKKRNSPPPQYSQVYAPHPDDFAMTRPCGIKCCKVFLIVLNFLFLLSGFLILGLGVWMQVGDAQAAKYIQIFHDSSCEQCMTAVQYFKVPYILIAVGGFVTLLSFLGCCGAWAESTCLLCLYALFLFLILIVEIGSAIIIGVYQNKITKCMECSMQHQVHYSYNNTNLPRLKGNNETDLLSLAWDTMQIELQCCGSTGPQDYKDSAWYNYTHPRIGSNVPPTCCALKQSGNPDDMYNRRSCQSEANVYDPTDEDQKSHILNTKGCTESFLEWLTLNVTIAVAILTAVIVLQILDFIAACLLLSRIRSETSNYIPPGYYPPHA